MWFLACLFQKLVFLRWFLMWEFQEIQHWDKANRDLEQGLDTGFDIGLLLDPFNLTVPSMHSNKKLSTLASPTLLHECLNPEESCKFLAFCQLHRQERYPHFGRNIRRGRIVMESEPQEILTSFKFNLGQVADSWRWVFKLHIAIFDYFPPPTQPLAYNVKRVLSTCCS